MSKPFFRENIFIYSKSSEINIPFFITPINGDDSRYVSVESFKLKITEIQNVFEGLSHKALREFRDYLKIDSSALQIKKIDADINLSKIVLAKLSYSDFIDNFTFSIYMADLENYVWDVGFDTSSTDVSAWSVEYFEHGWDLDWLKDFYSI
jgi:hypothetical protein